MIKRSMMFLVIVALLLRLPYPILALDLPGVAVSPSIINAEINKDTESFETTLTVENNTATDVVIELSPVDFGTMDESGGVAFLTQNSSSELKKYSLAAWMVIEKDIIAVDKGKKEIVKVTISDRDSLSPGGHYGAVILKVKSEADESGSQVAINQSVSSLFFVMKRGGEIWKTELDRLLHNGNLWKFPDKVEIRLQNSGNVHTIPRGKIEITGMDDKPVGRGIINEASAVVMPETFRNLPTIIKKYRWINLPGRYKIILSYRYDGLNQSQTKTVYWNYFGWEGVILAAVMLLIAVYVKHLRSHGRGKIT